MTIFSSWCDTSGAQSDKNMLVTVGVVTDERKLDRFNKDWAEALRDENVEELHMTKFEYYEDEYATWRGDEARRIAFLERLTKIGKRGMLNVFITGVDLNAYRAADDVYAVTETLGGAYSVGQLNCYFRIVNWLGRKKKKGAPHHIVCLIEQGDNGQDAFINFMTTHAFPVEALPKKSPNGQRHRPFEYADLIAYEHRRLFDANIRGTIWTERWRQSLIEIRRTIPTDIGIVAEEILEHWADEGHYPRLTPELRNQRALTAQRKKRKGQV
jgi:hypothetical protein